jgi:hypothetical protein
MYRITAVVVVEGLTLDGSFEECLARFAGSNSIVKARCNVSTDETHSFRGGRLIVWMRSLGRR